jgi:hypothetical protein
VAAKVIPAAVLQTPATDSPTIGWRPPATREAARSNRLSRPRTGFYDGIRGGKWAHSKLLDLGEDRRRPRVFVKLLCMVEGSSARGSDNHRETPDSSPIRSR